jgi:hypothetical protein
VDAEKVEDIFHHESERSRVDFKVGLATELPELKEDFGAPTSSYGGGYGYQAGGNGGFHENRGSRNAYNQNLPSSRGPRPAGRFDGN